MKPIHFWILFPALIILHGCGKPLKGRLANPGFENQRIQTTFFFAGQAKDGSDRYHCAYGNNMGLYTASPIDVRNLQWSESEANRDFVVGRMKAAGINVVTMSSWGEDFLPCNVGWPPEAPMQTASASHDELFVAAEKGNMLIMPLIESRGDWRFRDEFPTWTDGRVAPGTISQIRNLIQRYLQNPAHPEWAGRWAQVYDKNGEHRFAIAILQASSTRLAPDQHTEYAAGFDYIAAEIFNATGIKVGFFIDPLPPETNAPGNFRPSPEETGPDLVMTNSMIGIQSFIPEIWIDAGDLNTLINWKRDFSQRWYRTGLTFIMDVSSGYDARVVFPRSKTYGFNSQWQEAQTQMAIDFGLSGIVFNSWNGYTEGMVAVPMQRKFDPACCGDSWYNWLKGLLVK